MSLLAAITVKQMVAGVFLLAVVAIALWAATWEDDDPPPPVW